MKKKFLIAGHTATVFSAADNTDCPVIYTHIPNEEAAAVAALLKGTNAILVSVEQIDWNCDLTPWPAPGVFRNQGDFVGGADAYLNELTEHIVPAVEAQLGFIPSFRAIAGYSLAGLFAVYALYRTDIFQHAATISGALWYDGFLDFMKKNGPKRLPERVYFSLGDREKASRNPRLAAVEDCTAEAEKLIRGLGTETILEMNPGNHFMNVPERIEKGLRWLLNQPGKD